MMSQDPATPLPEKLDQLLLTRSWARIDPPPSTPIETLLPHPVQEKRRERLGTLIQKYKTLPPYALLGLEGVGVPFIGLREYMNIRALFTGNTRTLEDKNLQAYKAFLLFGHAQRVQSFYQKWQGEVAAPTLQKLLEEIVFPGADKWPAIDFRAWGDAFHMHGVKRTRGLFLTASPHIKPQRDGNSISLLKTSFINSARTTGKDLPDQTVEKITSLALRWGMNNIEYKRALRIYATRVEPANHQHILPEFSIPGERFGMPGTKFHALDRNDPVKLFIGNYTGCCEKICEANDNIEETIEHSYMHTGSTFYVVSGDNGIIAHSWAWRGKNNELCLDGFEAREESAFTPDNMVALLAALSEEMAKEEFAEFDLGELYIGKCNKYLEPKRLSTYDPVPVGDIKPKELAAHGMNKIKPDHYLSAVMNNFVLAL
jgi:hypothetical protein